MKYNLTQYPYPSQRRVVLGKHHAVATSQSLATLAGMEMFWAGGNAVDAAIASAIALTVVEPTSNGIGGDAFALVWAGGKLHGLNGSGKSPQAMNLKSFAGLESVPELSWLAVTVPGAVSTWQTLSQRWGKLPFEQLFAPAIRYAQEGFAVSPVTAAAWKQAEQVYLPLKDPQFTPFKQVFFPQGRAPNPGETWASPAHAQTLKEIADSEGESFYRGKLAEAIAKFAAESGLLSATDLANHEPLWVEPIATQYRQYRIWEIPPNTQGIAALMALNILEGCDLASVTRESASSYHQQIEAMKLAFADVHRHVSDPNFMEVSFEQLLDKAYATKRRQSIQHQALPLAEPGLASGGTVYLATADEELMVSFIQSNYHGFGCGILVPDTGIALHNRGVGFTLEAGHPNQVAPGKRPFHTIIPGFITESDRPLGPFGVMGGSMQPQGHLQMVLNLIDYGMNPQAALDAPRWRFVSDNQVLVESGVSSKIVRELRERGHNIQIAPNSMFGKGQIILSQAGGYVAASEPRADGMALAQ